MQVVHKSERQREEIQCDTLLQVNPICAGKLNCNTLYLNFYYAHMIQVWEYLQHVAYSLIARPCLEY